MEDTLKTMALDFVRSIANADTPEGEQACKQKAMTLTFSLMQTEKDKGKTAWAFWHWTRNIGTEPK